MNSRSMRNVFVYMLILVALVLVVVMVFRPSTTAGERPISYVIAEAKAGRVESIEVSGDHLTV
ncbi:MAG: cell division protein FtsH, partial [Chloroflexi bacterium]|nr:cell division protein FtsH [Chloroflexota bacterium]